MSTTIQVLQETDPLITLDKISEEVYEETESPRSDENMLARLRNLLKGDWAIPEIRLIVWSEEEGTWYMWKKAKDS